MRVGATVIGLVLSLVSCEGYVNTHNEGFAQVGQRGLCGSWMILPDDCTCIKLNELKN
jgi:hypothetical protein